MKTKNILFETLILLALNLHAEPADKPLNELDALVGRWMNLRVAIADEKQSWRDQEAHLRSEISLLENEAASLKKEIDDGDSFAKQIEKEHSEALKRKSSLDSQLEHLEVAIANAENILREWRKRIPSSLDESLNAAFDSLPDKTGQGDSRDLTKRAQNVAALFSRIETLQNRFHSTRETLEIMGVRRRVDVLYLGLAMAYAVSPADDWAGRGQSTDQGWTWETGGVDAASVRSAINIFNRQENARLVSLPVKINIGKGGGQ